MIGSPFALAMAAFGVMLLLLFLGMPVGFAMGLCGFFGLWYMTDLTVAGGTLATVAFNTVYNYILSAIPLFLLMGEFAVYSGLSQKLYLAAHRWVGHIPGGLAISTTLGAAGFGAISGSSTACAAAFATVAYPEMKRYGYDKGLTAGSFAAGGTLAAIIPPSIPLMIYAMLTELSIGQLFLAGILPGILNTTVFCVGIYLMVKRRPALAPVVAAASWKERFVTLKDTWIVLAVFIVVIGGIYGGIFTASEAAAVGAFAMFLTLVLGRRQTSKWRDTVAAFEGTLLSVGALFVIIVGSSIFAILLAKTQAPMVLADIITGWGLSNVMLMLVLGVLLLILGMLIPPLAIQFLVVPMVYPIILAAGYDGIHFGIMLLLYLELGNITPPVAVNLFIVKSILPEVSEGEIVRGVLPFIFLDFLVIGLIAAFPQISLLLPSIMMKR